MSIIKKPPSTMTREFHLQEPASQTFDNYARFIGRTPRSCYRSCPPICVLERPGFQTLGERATGNPYSRPNLPS